MTHELKNLMDRVADRPEPFTPDPDALVAAGRRRVRRRRLTESVAALAALAVVAVGAAVAVDLHDSRGAAPASRPSARPEDAHKLCTSSTGRSLGAEPWKWDEVVAITDQYGSASVRRQPAQSITSDSARYAFCITQRDVSGNVPAAARGGIVLRKTPIDDVSSVTTVFGRAHDPSQRVDVSTGDGQTGQGVIKSTFFVYRHVEARPWPGPTPTATVQIYATNGVRSSVGRW